MRVYAQKYFQSLFHAVLEETSNLLCNKPFYELSSIRHSVDVLDSASQISHIKNKNGVNLTFGCPLKQNMRSVMLGEHDEKKS